MTLVMLYRLGKLFGRPPSQWLHLSISSTSDAVLALDFDAACYALGLDQDEQIAEATRRL